MKIFEPEPQDVLDWVQGSDGKWPASDWDYYVMNGRNDTVVLALASDMGCTKRWFFVHCLHYLVGDFFNEGATDQRKKERIEALLRGVDDLAAPDVEEWRSKTRAALDGKEKVVPAEWLHYGV